MTKMVWAEEMEMIKDFFGTIIARMDRSEENSNKRFDKLEKGFKEMKLELKQVDRGQKDTVLNLTEFRQEQAETNERLEKKVELNTDSMAALTDEFHEVKNLEFQVFDQERRITKLEKAR